MRIAILSDQHGILPRILECDLMVLSGDLKTHEDGNLTRGIHRKDDPATIA